MGGGKRADGDFPKELPIVNATRRGGVEKFSELWSEFRGCSHSVKYITLFVPR